MVNFTRSEDYYELGPEEEDGHFRKRYKTSSMHSNQEWSSSSIQFPVPPAQYNPLDEPSPLGLKLRKSPSLLDLIQMKLSKTNASPAGTAPCGDFIVEKKKDVKASAASSSIDKMKASNFLASFLKIGNWEYVSRHEGDLIAKCYYSKHKLVWEVLDGGLKSKIEIQWSDIIALKASCPDDKPGNLIIVLARPPLFFKENNPQPRKHTLWMATADFTDGQASLYRKHYLQCPPGVLNKNFKKLIQCDMRLKCLSQQPGIVYDSPYFVSLPSGSESDVSRNQVFNQLQTATLSPISSVESVVSPFEQMGTLGIAPLHPSKEVCSPSSGVFEANGICEGHNFSGLKNWEQLNVPALQQSMSMNDLVNHIEHHISDQMTSGNTSECKDMLDNIAQLLLGDTQTITALDEKSLMSRVNSLCCLLQDPVAVSSDQPDRETGINVHIDSEPKIMCDSTPSMFEINTVTHQSDISNITSCIEPSSMPRSDSFGDLLFHLPRVASFPYFLSNIPDGDNHS